MSANEMAIKIFVPAPPTPSFEAEELEAAKKRAAESRIVAESQSVIRAKKPQIAPFGIEFFGRVEKSSLWFGAVIGLLVWSATRSQIAILSFLLGCAVSLLMLRSQVWFVTSLVRPKSEGRPNAQKMLWLLQPLKYAILLVLFWWALRAQTLNAAFLALGVSLTPFVIFANAFGRMFAHNARPLSEVYGTQKSSTQSKPDVN